MEPKESQNDIQMFFRFTSSGSLSDANNHMREIEKAVDAHRSELHVARVRTRFRETHGRMTLYLDKQKRTEEQRAAIEKRLEAVLPVLAGVEGSKSWRGREGRGGEIALQLVGDDSEELATLSEEVRKRLKLLDGVSDVITDLETGNDEIRVRVKRDRASRAGIDSWVASGTVSTALRGSRLPDLRIGGREVPLILQFPEDDRENLTQLSSVTLYPPGGGTPLPLGSVADFEFAKGLAGIHHENRKTSMGLRVVAAAEDTKELSQRVTAALAAFPFPQGITYDMSSWVRRWQREEGDYGFSMLMSVIFVFLIMGILFESWILPFSVLSCVPFSFLGVYWFLYLTGTTMDLMAMIGIVVLVGVVVNNAIVLVDRINQLRAEGMDRMAACIEGTRSRFRPIWMTALTTIVGLIPMAFGEAGIAGVPYAPLARTVIGGLTAATVMTLFAIPVAYTLFDDLGAGMRKSLRKLRPGRAAGVEPLPMRPNE